MICYITVYYDINRSEWSNKFKRSFQDYLSRFKPFIELFKNDTEDEMIVFIDEKYYEDLHNITHEAKNIKLIKLNQDILKDDIYCWSLLDKEREIMTNPEYRFLLGDRTIYPEHNYPEYTLINHSKIDFVSRVIDLGLSTSEYYAWVDFGFFSKTEDIPNKLLDINKFNLDKINYTLINPLDDNKDNNIYYTLRYAPEKIGGFFFLGRKDKIKEYQELYHTVLNQFQEKNIADDDQHVALRCYYKQPELFSFNVDNYGWHKVFVANQKTVPVRVISFCLWGNEQRYVIGLIENIKLAKIYYPDWVCWIYIHTSVNNDIYNKLSLFDNVKIIIKKDENIRSKRFMLWRFEPMCDNSVEYFMSRDTDTRIQPREVLAVDEWINSGKILHIMRDHPQHYPKILGGMYGINPKQIMNNWNNWIELIEEFYKNHGEDVDDQYFLELYIYNQIKSTDRIIHDEIKKYEGSECLDFPIKYEQNNHFVGCYIYENGETDPQTAHVLRNWLENNLKHRISEYNISLEEKLFYLKNVIDDIYVIHYTKLVSRKKNLSIELRKHFLDRFFKVNWVENFDRETLTPEIIQKSCIFNPNVLKRYLTAGEIANGLAHTYVLEQIQNNNTSLVFEDDTIFKENFIHHLYHIMKILPPDIWEVVCLGGPTEIQKYPSKTLENSTKLKFNSEEIILYSSPTRAPCSLSAMLYSSRGVKKILKSGYFRPLCAPSDHTVWFCCMEQKVYMLWSQPWITYEGSKTELFSSSLDTERGF